MTSISALNLSRPIRDLFRQLVSFGTIGAASTLAYVALYTFMRQAAPAALANAVALLTTALGNTAANRRLTFAVRGSDGLARDHAAGLLGVAVALAITSAGLAVLPIVDPRHGGRSEIAILIAANAVATLVRFLLLRLALDRSDVVRQSAPARIAAARLPDLRLPAAPRFDTLSQWRRTRG
jgi:putative flippase GtrA